MDSRSSWVDVTKAAGPILLRPGGETKMELFTEFRRGTENRGFIQINFFFAEVFQIISRFVLTNKILRLGAL